MLNFVKRVVRRCFGRKGLTLCRSFAMYSMPLYLMRYFLPKNYHHRFFQYFQDQNAELTKLVTDLKRDMDELSQDVVDRYINMYAIGIKGHRGLKTWLPVYFFFTQKEWKARRQSRKWGKNCRVSFELEGMLPDIEQFAVDYGLKYIQDNSVHLKDTAIADCGGYVGDSALAFSKYAPGHIHIFEPSPKTVTILERILKTNGIDRMTTIHNVAVGDREDVIFFDEDFGCSPRASLSEKKEGLSVPKVRLDSVMNDSPLRCGLIKMDVEGMEYETVEGAKETIVRDRPILIISLYHSPKDFFEIKPLIESWNLTYHFEIRQCSYYGLVYELCLLAWQEV